MSRCLHDTGRLRPGVGFNAGTETHGVSSDMRGLAARQISGPTLSTAVCTKKRC